MFSAVLRRTLRGTYQDSRNITEVRAFELNFNKTVQRQVSYYDEYRTKSKFTHQVVLLEIYEFIMGGNPVWCTRRNTGTCNM